MAAAGCDTRPCWPASASASRSTRPPGRRARRPPGAGRYRGLHRLHHPDLFRPEAARNRTLIGSFAARGINPRAPPVARPALDRLMDDALDAAGGRDAPRRGPQGCRRAPRLVGRAPAGPRAGGRGLVTGVTSVYDMTPDEQADAGRVAPAPTAACWRRFSGTGFEVYPAMGEAVAALVAGRRLGRIGYQGGPPGLVDQGLGRSRTLLRTTEAGHLGSGGAGLRRSRRVRLQRSCPAPAAAEAGSPRNGTGPAARWFLISPASSPDRRAT